jgi:hypothetical protein
MNSQICLFLRVQSIVLSKTVLCLSCSIARSCDKRGICFGILEGQKRKTWCPQMRSFVFWKERREGHSPIDLEFLRDTSRFLVLLLVFQRKKNVDDGSKKTGAQGGIYGRLVGALVIVCWCVPFHKPRNSQHMDTGSVGFL